MNRRLVIRDDADLLIEAEREVASFLAPLVAELASARARFMVAEIIEQRGLVPREQFGGQPSANEVLVAVLRRLEEHAGRPQATAVGAHDIARRVGVSMGVVGADRYPALRRTREQVDRDPSPKRPREGTRGLVGGRSRYEQEGRR